MARNYLKHMEAAIAVAEELNFSRAAKRLRSSQPAITKHIAELEQSLGVLLFVRDHHAVSLTEAGKAYVEEARIAVLPVPNSSCIPCKMPHSGKTRAANCRMCSAI